MYDKRKFSDSWAIILGGSSGFGLATVEKLAEYGMNSTVVYRETATQERSLRLKMEALAEKQNVSIELFNINALDAATRQALIQKLKEDKRKEGAVRLLLHSIARGNLKPLMPQTGMNVDSIETLSVEDIRYTTYAMSTSLLDWARELLAAGLFQKDGRIIGLTSEGAHKHWDGYGAVSIAKSSLESLSTYMAVELGRFGIKTNLIQAGITETPSLNKIPGSEKLIQVAKERNPLGRVTQTTDVANVIYLLCTDEAGWINGSVIHVDGGEHCR
ncbi:SDR family oxidoreductase [Mucilaginibacter sp.]|uniref:SDR family oxidoreductase n=1 Tax=Mucilaginibacter sp. TaxID=1882438 RepID=UPI00326710F0